MNYFQKSKACQEKNRSHINNHGSPKWSRLGFWVGTPGTVRPWWLTVQNRILKVKMWTFYFTCVVFSNWIVHSSGLVEIKSFHNFEFKTAIFEMQVQTWYFQSKIKWKYQIFRSILWYTFARLLLDLPSLIFWQKYSSVDIYSGRSLLISLRQDFSSSQKKFV